MTRSKKTLLDRLERKFGKYAISNLIKYIIILNIIGTVVILLDMNANTNIYYGLLSLDFSKILKGQVWRLFTFIIYPPTSFDGGMSILWVMIELYMYFVIGSAIENAIGSFKFNCYYLLGILFNILSNLIIYIIFGFSVNVGIIYINRSLFFLFAMLYPSVEFLLFFILPVKAKWIAWFDGIWIGIDLFRFVKDSIDLFKAGYNDAAVLMLTFALAIVLSLLNFFIFYMLIRKQTRMSFKQRQASKQFKNKIKKAQESKVDAKGARHKCCICGRTELDDPDLQFRYCSKCAGNHEYCSDHLFTHTHVQ